MDAEARLYQDQLHKMNQDRMGRLEEKLDRTLGALAQIAEAIKNIPDVERRIDALEDERSFRKGFIAALVLMAGLAGGLFAEAFKWVLHHFAGK